MNAAARHTTKRPKRPWKFPTIVAFGTLIIVLGAALVLYPITASWISQYNQSKLVDNVTIHQQQVDTTETDAALADAREYNRLLVGGVIVEANQRKATGNVESEGLNYFDLLNANESGVMGRLRINAIDVDLPIYHGTSDETLTKGVGHLRGTALPVAGTSQRPVLTAHRGYPEATLFNDLDKLKTGDTFTIEVFGETSTYRIIDTEVINPEDTESISVEPDKDLVSLITCTPLGVNTHRILVTGERVVPTPIKDIEEAGKPSTLPHFPWWIPAMVLTLVVAGLIIWRSGYTEAARKAKKASVHNPESASETPPKP